MDERRRADRTPAAIPTRIHTEDKRDRVGVIQNVSSTGSLLATPSSFRIGDRAELQLVVPDEEPQTVSGKIVRLELTDIHSGPLLYRVAVRFLKPLSNPLAFVSDLPS